jgi:ribosome maturation factor RimP
MQSATTQRIWELVEPIAADSGLEIVDIELHREGRGNVLRVYLDREGGSGGVDLDALTRVSRELSAALDVDDLIPSRYTLEVSSPGINRRLRVPAQFQRYIGEQVRVRTFEPIDGRRTFLGTLRAVHIDGVVITTTPDREDFVPFNAIAHANYEHDFSAKRGH